MLQIAICDDSSFELENARRMAELYTQSRPDIDFSIHSFQSAYDLLECVQYRQGFSIYLLDVIMPDIDGINLGEIIRRSDDSAVIIYLTSSPDFALKSYSVRAFHYLVKPYTAQQLFHILDNAIHTLEVERARSILVKTPEGFRALRYHAISYAECREHCIYYHLEGGLTVRSVTLRESFEQTIEPLLSDSRFVKISVSYLANLQFVRGVTKKSFLMSDGCELPISRAIYSQVKKRYVDYLLERTRNRDQ